MGGTHRGNRLCSVGVFRSSSVRLSRSNGLSRLRRGGPTGKRQTIRHGAARNRLDCLGKQLLHFGLLGRVVGKRAVLAELDHKTLTACLSRHLCVHE